MRVSKRVIWAFFGLLHLLYAVPALAQLSGSYTIDAGGKGARNFASITDALDELQKKGVDGPVHFSIAKGVYVGSFNVAAIKGTSAKNQITFDGKSPHEVKLLSQSNAATLTVSGAAHLLFSNMTIENEYKGTYYNVLLKLGADSVAFANCRFNCKSNNFGFNTYISQSNNITFSQCVVQSGYYGMYISGAATTPVQNLQVLECDFNNQNYFGIYGNYARELTINGCYIDSFASAAYGYPVYLNYTNKVHLLNNKIWSGYYGILISNSNFSSANDTNLIYNNMIGNSYYYAISNSNTINCKYYNNSIDFSTDYANGSAVYVDNGKGHEWLNNSIKCEGAKYGIYINTTSTGQIAAFDYNNLYFQNCATYAYFETKAYTNFSDLSKGNGVFHVHNQQVDPAYRGERNLRSFAPGLNNLGVAVDVLYDIDGNRRPNPQDKKYDIGCNEFWLANQDLDIYEITGPLTVGAANTVEITLVNQGTGAINNKAVVFAYSTDSGKTYVKEIDSIKLLKPGEKYQFKFAKKWRPGSAGSFQLRVKIDQSVSGDPDVKDEMRLQLCSGLKGTYTIDANGSGPYNFKTLQAAFGKLHCGLAGHTTFKIAPGNYNTHLLIDEIIGSSPDATLTIDGIDADSVSIYFAGNSYVDAATVELRGLTYVKLQNLHIESTASGSMQGIRLVNNCRHISISHCKISSTTATGSQSAGVAATNPYSFYSGTGASNIQVSNCEISGYYSGLYFQGYSTANPLIAIRLMNNFITDYRGYGISIRNADSSYVAYNTITNALSDYATAYYEQGCLLSYLLGNVVIDYGLAAFVLDKNRSASANLRPQMINNMVAGTCSYSGNSQNPSAIDLQSGADDWAIWHNSILFSAPNQKGNSAYGYQAPATIRITECYNLDVRNNIFYDNSNIDFAVIAVLNKATFTSFDYNNYYTLSGSVSYDGSLHNTLGNWAKGNVQFNKHSVSKKPLFLSASNLNLSKNAESPRGYPLGISKDIKQNKRCDISPSLGAFESGYATPKPSVFFAVDDTLYLNSPYQILNSADISEMANYKWYLDKKLVSESLHLHLTMSEAGTHTIMLVTENCGGKDSFSKTIIADTARKAPVVDFAIRKTVLSIGEETTLTDLSTNGPDHFNWKISPAWIRNKVSGLLEKTYVYINGSDSTVRNPQLVFNIPGSYSICLSAANAKGKDSLCKADYIVVKDQVAMCSGNSSSMVQYGTLSDPGGLNEDYAGGANYNCDFLISPCVKNLHIVFKSLDLSPGDYLRIYDGEDNTAPPLHTYNYYYKNGINGKSTAPFFKDTLWSLSGKFYFEFLTQSHLGAPGFELEWQGEKFIGKAPLAKIDLPDTVCKGVDVFPQNLSSGFQNKYLWFVNNGSEVLSSDSAASFNFSKSGVYTIKLLVQNCFGSSIDSHKVMVAKPLKTPIADFNSPFTNARKGVPVTVYQNSSGMGSNCATSWKWRFEPDNVVYAKGFDANSPNAKVVFQDTGCYHVTLWVSNLAGTDSITKYCYFHVLDVCRPSVAFLNSDVGISRVKMGEIDNKTATGVAAYTDYTSGVAAKLQVGSSASIIIERAANPVNAINRAVWIDLNQDGNFDENTEKVAFSGPDMKLADTLRFRVKSALLGKTTMRVGVNISNKSNKACGPNIFGEYEDYTIEFIRDETPPEIYFEWEGKTKSGPLTVFTQQCSNWKTPKAFAVDNVDDTFLVSAYAGLVNTADTGAYDLHFAGTDKAGNTSYSILKVVVQPDTTAPQILLNGPLVDTLAVFESYHDKGFTAVDNCSGTVQTKVSSSVDSSKLGEGFVHYWASDAKGNIAKLQRSVLVVDVIPPVIESLEGGDTVWLPVFEKYVDEGLKASDNYTVAKALQVLVSGKVNVNETGTYNLQYVVSDESGNISTPATRTVVVYDSIAPVVSLLNADTVQAAVGSKFYDWGVKTNDNYNSFSELSLSKSGSLLATLNKGDELTQLGFFDLIYTVADEAGNTSSATRVVWVTDKVAPTAILRGDEMVFVKRWQDYNDAGVDLYDNYWKGSGLWYSTRNNVNTQLPGTYYFEYCPHDSSGNGGTCVSRYIVVQEPNGIDEAEAGSMTVYPNPAINKVLVQLPTGSETVWVAVYNELGKEVARAYSNSTNAFRCQFDLGGLASGIYLVKAEGSAFKATQKLVISR
ncbi:DUF5011 domain-containing protein [bacterium]|nr:DUF5011 domain-containing protein [bacterium]